jgi:hypothetical protein
MTYHQSSAVSVAILLTAATVIVVGYRLGRSHASWRDVRTARRAVRASRRDALSHTAQVVAGGVVFMAMVFLAAWNLGR